MRFAGAVLTGGRSTRMGRTKALVEIDDVPMARLVADALADVGCTPVVLAGGDPAELAPLGLRVVPDGPLAGRGPVAGVLAVLDDLAGVADAVVVAPCDVPGLSADMLAPLVAAFDETRPAAAAARTTRLEPAVAVWSTQSRVALRAAALAGDGALRQLLRDVDALEVPVSGEFRNVKTPDDLGVDPRG